MKHKVLVLCFLLSQVSFLMGSENYGIAVHGGAGVMKNLSENQKQKIEEKIIKTLTEAFKIIEQGGTSMDAVELLFQNLRILLYLTLAEVQSIIQKKSRKWMHL